MSTTTAPGGRRGAAPPPAGRTPARGTPSRRAQVSAAGRLASVALPVLGLAAVVVLPALLVGPVQVTSAGMAPTLRPGDVVLVDRRAVDLDHLARGDLVTLRQPGTGTETVKRVVGLPGDEVPVAGAAPGGGAAAPPGAAGTGTGGGAGSGVGGGVTRAPAGAVWVVGDNPTASVDSRALGPVPADDLDGRVLLRVWPPEGSRPTDPPPPPDR